MVSLVALRRSCHTHIHTNMMHTREPVETRYGEWKRSEAMIGHPFDLFQHTVGKTVFHLQVAVCCVEEG